MRLTPGGGIAMWVTSRARGSVCASLWVAVIPSSAAPGCLRPCGGRTGARVVTHGAEPRASWQSAHAQPVSTQALCEVHQRMTPRRGAPPGGQQAARGCGGTRCVGVQARGCAGTIIRRRGVGRDGTAGREQATVADVQQAVGQDRLEAPTANCQSVEASLDSHHSTKT